MRCLLGLALLALARVAVADQVTLPLAVDYPVLAAALTAHLHPAADGSAVLWGRRDGCRSFTVRGIHLETAGSRVRLTASGRARVGFGFLGMCIAPLAWE